MNKANLIAALAKKFELSISKTNEPVSHTLLLITKALVKNETVQLIGFGSFSVKKRKARDGRNPRVGKALKKSVNKK